MLLVVSGESTPGTDGPNRSLSVEREGICDEYRRQNQKPKNGPAERLCGLPSVLKCRLQSAVMHSLSILHGFQARGTSFSHVCSLYLGASALSFHTCLEAADCVIEAHNTACAILERNLLAGVTREAHNSSWRSRLMSRFGIHIPVQRPRIRTWTAVKMSRERYFPSAVELVFGNQKYLAHLMTYQPDLPGQPTYPGNSGMDLLGVRSLVIWTIQWLPRVPGSACRARGRTVAGLGRKQARALKGLQVLCIVLYMLTLGYYTM